MQASECSAVVDYKDWQVPLGRRFRALKLWFVMRMNGVEGLRSFIRSHVAMAERLEGLIRADTRFEVQPLSYYRCTLRESRTESPPNLVPRRPGEETCM